jgi:hypothetical protein
MAVRREARMGAAAALGMVVLASACGGVRSCAGPRPPAGAFLYVVHDPPKGHPVPGADPRIATFQIDPGTGALSAVGTSLAAQAVGAFALDRDPGGRWFLLTGSQLGLQRVGGSGALERVDVRAAGLASAFDPRGRYVYVVDGRGLGVYAFDERRGPALSTALHLESAVIAPRLQPSADGATLFALTDDLLRVYTVGDGGQLTAVPGSPMELGMHGLQVFPHPSGAFVAVVGDERGRRRVAVLRPATGGYEPVDGSPFDLGAGLQGVTMTPDGSRLFAADDDTGAIATYAFDNRGGLHSLASTAAPAKRLVTLQTDASGRFLYATAIDNPDLYGWSVADDGSLAAVPGLPVRLEGEAGDLSTSPPREGPIVAKALPDASAFDAEPTRFAVSSAPFPSDASINDLAARLSDPSAETRYAAIVAMGPRQDLELVLPAVIEALDDPNEGIRLRARHIIGPWALAHPGRVDDAVLDRLLVGPNGRGLPIDNASLSALRALKQRGADAAPYLARALVTSGQLRGEARGALVALGEDAVPAVPELRRLLGESQVQQDAAYVLGAIGPRAADALPELEALLDHPSRSVANSARLAIDRIRSFR